MKNAFGTGLAPCKQPNTRGMKIKLAPSMTLTGGFLFGSPSRVRYSEFCSVFSSLRFFFDNGESQSITPIVFALIILLFALDSTGVATNASRKKSDIL